MTDLDIEQAVATGLAKLSTEAYSRYLKQDFGLADYCPSSRLSCLQLFLFAIGGWDNRPGAVNPYSVKDLNSLTTKLHEL